jgi:ankyrin repeat protein
MNLKSMLKLASVTILALVVSQSGFAMENPAKFDLFENIMQGDLEAVKDDLNFLQSSKAIDLINGKNMNGNTPLHCACSVRCQAIVKTLLDYGADINCANEDGDTPLHWAAFSGFKEIVKILLDRGVDINCKNRVGETALDVARNHKEITQLIANQSRRSKGYATNDLSDHYT